MIALWVSALWMASPSPSEMARIDTLLARLETSGCRFERNGTWHAAPAAADHLRRKRDALVARGLVGTAEQFLERGAIRSSVSGKPYRVACPDRPAEAARTWWDRQLRDLPRR